VATIYNYYQGRFLTDQRFAIASTGGYPLPKQPGFSLAVKLSLKSSLCLDQTLPGGLRLATRDYHAAE